MRAWSSARGGEITKHARVRPSSGAGLFVFCQCVIGRPVAWGLAAYGADGVQHVMELLQSELARDMAMCGKVNLKAIDRSMVKVHKW